MKGRVEGLRNKFEFGLQEEKGKKGTGATGGKRKEKKEPSERKEEILSSGMKRKALENPRKRSINCQQLFISNFMTPKIKPELGLFEENTDQKSDFSALTLTEEERQKGRRLGLAENCVRIERPIGKDLASHLGTKRNRVKMCENGVKSDDIRTYFKTEKDS